MQPGASSFRDVTRATKFQKKFQLPSNFADVLKDFTREVLREQPTDIYGYAAGYFKRLALEADGLEEVPPKQGCRGRKPLSLEERQLIGEMRTRLLDAFTEEDLDGTLRIPADVVKRVLTHAVGIAPDHAVFLVSNCHDNLHLLDGSVEYQRFVDASAAYIHFFLTTNYVFPARKDTVHGMTHEELHTRLLSALQQADADRSGRLLLADYHACLQRVPLQLTRRDITLLAAEAVVAGDNHINIADEALKAFVVLQHSAAFEAFQADWDEGRV
eukprot:GGOE01061595.1.p1 GENE.GGOE01061595.1~~GGOE01061595.1.p1  ORF type:complete len:272 (+),score=106.36 GGOE01061595.1:159-974(+)